MSQPPPQPSPVPPDAGPEGAKPETPPTPYPGIRPILRQIRANRRREIEAHEQQGVSKDRWDEVCFSFCNQKVIKRSKEGQPSCTMYCIRRQLAPNEPPKDTVETTETRKRYVGDVPRWNFLNGYYLWIGHTPDRCIEHVQGMTGYTSPPSPSSTAREIDLGQRMDDALLKVKSTFSWIMSPSQSLLTRYWTSWQDGTQQAFFWRYVESLKRGDAGKLVWTGVERVTGWDPKWRKDDKDDDKRKWWRKDDEEKDKNNGEDKD